MFPIRNTRGRTECSKRQGWTGGVGKEGGLAGTPQRERGGFPTDLRSPPTQRPQPSRLTQSFAGKQWSPPKPHPLGPLLPSPTPTPWYSGVGHRHWFYPKPMSAARIVCFELRFRMRFSSASYTQRNPNHWGKSSKMIDENDHRLW